MANIMEDMEPCLLNLVQNQLDSFTKWDLLRFLYYHPERAYSVEDLAWQMNRKQSGLEDEAEALVAAGLAERRWVESQPAFALTRDPITRQVVERFVQGCEDRGLRLKMAYCTLRSMNTKQHRPSHKRSRTTVYHILSPVVGRRRMAV